MPLIEVHHPRDALSPEQRSAIGRRLTEVITEIEGGASTDSPKARAIAWVMFHPIDDGAWFIGGETDDIYVSPPGRFLVRVYVPEGSLSRDGKAQVHKAVDDVFLEAFGLEPTQDRWPSLFVHIHEWGEGNLGLFGRSHGLGEVGAYAGAGSAAVRARARTYLKARAAWRAGAGFPD